MSLDDISVVEVEKLQRKHLRRYNIERIPLGEKPRTKILNSVEGLIDIARHNGFEKDLMKVIRLLDDCITVTAAEWSVLNSRLFQLVAKMQDICAALEKEEAYDADNLNAIELAIVAIENLQTVAIHYRQANAATKRFNRWANRSRKLFESLTPDYNQEINHK